MSLYSDEKCNIINDHNVFLKKVNDYLENLTYYNKKFIRIEIRKLYDDGDYNFTIDNKDINRIINDYKNKSIKFNKEYIFLKEKNNKKKILREYSYFLIETYNKKESFQCEYAIWSSDLLIAHMRESKFFFIDATWYQPHGFQQLLIIMFKDVITHEKYPGFFIIMNNKTEELYTRIFYSVLNILTQNKIYSLKLEFIITGTEMAMINAIHTVFINIKRIGCYFHLKYDCFLYLKKKHFFNEENKTDSENILNEIGLIPLNYKGDMKIFEDIISDIIARYPTYNDFINNYFIKNKKNFFQNGIYNYALIPQDCRTNSFLENYNNYIKQNLGKKYSFVDKFN